MNVSEAKKILEELEAKGHGTRELWATHPEYQVQWGPIRAIDLAVTERFYGIVLIDTFVELDK